MSHLENQPLEHSNTASASSDDGLARQETEVEKLGRIHTFERVGTHAQYYEKGGLRTEGDGIDHDGTHHKV